MAAGGDHPPLVERQGAEPARPEAAAVVDDREADLLDGGHAALAVVDRVRLADVGQLRHGVQLGGREGHGRGREDQAAVPVGLDHGAAPDGVVLVVLHQVRLGVGALVPRHRLERRDQDRREAAGVRAVRREGRAADVRERLHRLPRGETAGDLPHGPLAHAVDEQVRPRVEEDGPPDLVLPVIIVGEAPQGRLQPADHDGDVRPEGADPLRIDDRRPVRAQARPATGGIGVVVAALLRGGVVGDHRVDVAAVDEDAVARAAEGRERLVAPPVRLGQDRDAVALCLQHAADDRRAEGGVIHVGIAGDEQEVIVPPAALFHLRLGDGQELRVHSRASQPS